MSSSALWTEPLSLANTVFFLDLLDLGKQMCETDIDSTTLWGPGSACGPGPSRDFTFDSARNDFEGGPQSRGRYDSNSTQGPITNILSP